MNEVNFGREAGDLPPEARSENWETFKERLKELPLGEEEFQSIDFAYDLAKKGHELQVRDTGERYFEHPRAVAIILMDECGAEDSNLITSSLLHDTVEDTTVFSHTKGRTYAEWSKMAKYRLGKCFGEKVADTVIALTKFRLDSGEHKSAEEAQAKYLKNLEKETEKGNPDVLIVKMADRLHNLRTLKEVNEEKKDRIIQETKSDYLPLFEKAIQRWEASEDESEKKVAEWGNILLEKIKEELASLEAK